MLKLVTSSQLKTTCWGGVVPSKGVAGLLLYSNSHWSKRDHCVQAISAVKVNLSEANKASPKPISAGNFRVISKEGVLAATPPKRKGAKEESAFTSSPL